jgi:Trypsin
MVAIYRQQTGSSEFHCAGTLVSQRLVVTAAHCIYIDPTYTLSLDETVLFVGRFNLLEWIKRDSEPRTPSQFFVHPGYVDLSNDADIALILMSQPVDFSDLIQPLCLPPPSATTTVPLLLTTWEKDEFQSLVAGEPRTIQVPVVPNSQCLNSDRIVCVGGQRWRGPCNIDSGAALIGQIADDNDDDEDNDDVEDQRWYLSGLLSTTLPDPGIRYCNLKRFTVFTKVTSFSEWIASYISQYA